MSTASDVVQSWGLTVGPFGKADGGVLFAEVTPHPFSCCRVRWRYEISSTTPGEDYMTTWAAVDGGSGGALTLRACVRRATRALRGFQMAEEETKHHAEATSEA